MKKTTLLSVSLFVLMFVFALILRLLKVGEIPLQFYAALLGASITVVITNLLLNSQTQSEFDKQKQEKVYEEKLRFFQEYLKMICNLSLGRSISTQQQIDLQYQASLISMHMAPENIKEVLEKTDKILTNRCQLDERNDADIRRLLMDIVQCFRRELYGSSTQRPLDPQDNIFVNMAMNATLYNEFPQVGVLPSNHTFKQECTDFLWHEEVQKWMNLGWKKDVRNVHSDYLRFYFGRRCDPKAYIEIRFEIYYQHYILRAFSKMDNNVNHVLMTKFGGFTNGQYWWKVMDSPFYEFEPGELMKNFDVSPQYKKALYPWFEAVIYEMNLHKSPRRKRGANLKSKYHLRKTKLASQSGQ